MLLNRRDTLDMGDALFTFQNSLGVLTDKIRNTNNDDTKVTHHSWMVLANSTLFHALIWAARPPQYQRTLSNCAELHFHLNQSNRLIWRTTRRLRLCLLLLQISQESQVAIHVLMRNTIDVHGRTYSCFILHVNINKTDRKLRWCPLRLEFEIRKKTSGFFWSR